MWWLGLRTLELVGGALLKGGRVLVALVVPCGPTLVAKSHHLLGCTSTLLGQEANLLACPTPIGDWGANLYAHTTWPLGV